MAATQRLNVEGVLAAAGRVLRERLSLEGILVYLPDTRTPRYTLALAQGVPEHPPAQLERARVEAEPLYRRVLQQGDVGEVFGRPADPLLQHAAGDAGRLSASLAPIPLRPWRGQGRAEAGLLVGLVRRPRRFAPAERDAFQAAARHLGTAVENARLYRSVLRYSADLKDANEELGRTMADREELNQVIVHDMRTPSTIVRSYVALLLEGHFGPLRDRQAEPSTIVAHDVETLVRLAADMAALGSLDDRPTHLEPRDLKELVRLAVRSFQLQAAEGLGRAQESESEEGAAGSVEPVAPTAPAQKPIPEHVAVWDTTSNELRLQMTRETFDAWLAGTRAVDVDGNTLIVGVPNVQARAWLEERLAGMVRRTLRGVPGRFREVQFVVVETTPRRDGGCCRPGCPSRPRSVK